MRTIKFRGKRKTNGDWIYGDLLQVPIAGWCSIMEQTASALNTPVIPETVGQFTGRKDMNEKEIYGGDKIKFTLFDFNGNDTQYEGIVEFEFGSWVVTYSDGNCGCYLFEVEEETIEVIGTIHDDLKVA